MHKLQKVLLVWNEPGLGIVEGLRTAFSQRDIEADIIYRSHSRTFFDRFIIHVLNKQLHNFGLQPKNKNKFENHPLSYRNLAEANLVKKVETYSPDLVLLLRGHSRRRETLIKIRKHAKLYGWWIEGEEECTTQVPDEIKYFDWYFFLSGRCLDMMRERGYSRTSYQNHVINFDIFRPLPQSKSHTGRQYDACFVGKWSEKRQKYIEAALEVTRNIAIYGPKWRIKNLANLAVLRCVKGNGIFGDRLVSLYGRTGVVVNITNWGGNNKQKRSGMNMRVLEVPACGAFLLTDTSIEMGDFLTPGVHVGTYETLDEFKSKLAYYVEHPEERRKIALDGMRHSREIDIGYPQFVDKIVEIFQSGEMPRDIGGPAVKNISSTSC